MYDDGLFYSEPIFRPPSEGKYSLLLTLTVGCTYNCTFCYPYRNKKFRIRSFDEVLTDIEKARKVYGSSVRRIFLLDGNAFVANTKLLIRVANACYNHFPNLNRITAYAHAKDILRKSIEDLKAIKNAGITMLYVGLETGYNPLLDKINKQTTAEEMIKAGQLLHQAQIILSGTIILGLGGDDLQMSKKHALATADLINKLNPPTTQDWYISALTLMVPPNTPIQEAVLSGQFNPLSPDLILEELKLLLENISPSVHDCIFRSNHASNYLPLKGILAKDCVQLLDTINSLLSNPDRSSIIGKRYRSL